MAKRVVVSAPALSRLRAVRPFLLPLLGGTLATLLAVLAFQKVESFLAHDERFLLRPSGPGVPVSPDLRVTGLSRTPGAAVRRVFQEDEGRSVLLIPLAERRQQLLQIQWVREASVSRAWPNRIEVRVTERVPQAFVRLPAPRRGSPSIPALIDEEGVILPAPANRGTYELPVLAGIRDDQPHAERAARVRLMRALLADLSRAADQVAEVDAADLTNWKIVLEVQDRAVTLILGEGDYGKKVQRFLQHWPEIQKRAPNAYKFDLRLADRITAVEEAPAAQNPSTEPESIVAGVTG
jgi:cell division protein FtsQ